MWIFFLILILLYIVGACIFSYPDDEEYENRYYGSSRRCVECDQLEDDCECNY